MKMETSKPQNDETNLNRRVSVTIEPLEVVKPGRQVEAENVIDEGFDESISSDSDESFLGHMKKIIGKIPEQDSSDSSRSVTTDPEFMEEEERSIRTGKFDKSNENDLINSRRDPKSERTKRIQEYYKAKEEFYEGYKYKKLLDQLMMQNKIIEELERKESLK